METRSGKSWSGLPVCRPQTVKQHWGNLLVLAGLRHLEESVEQEARKMPILNDILDNKVAGQ